VFRGFRTTIGPGGRVRYDFLWLLRRPMHAVFDPRRGTLRFEALFPDVDRSSGMIADLGALVASRSTRQQLPHKRVDRRRARVTCGVRDGHWSLAVHIRGANHGFAVSRVLNLINDLVLRLQEAYPDYLVERFGMSAE
jgi:hypothetical protein